MMVVRSVNGVFPDFGGNVNTPKGIIYANDPDKQLKLWTGVATTVGTNGEWEIDYTSAAFTTVVDVNPKLYADSWSQANAPMATNIKTVTNTKTSGKAFKASSAGLLAAMQQTPVEPGTRVMISVIGY